MKTHCIIRGRSTGRATRLLRLMAIAVAALITISGAPPTADAATSIVVNNLVDVVDGGDGLCTLREAIVAANTNLPSGVVTGECPAGAMGADTISFSGSGTLPLTLGELPLITEAVTIDGGSVVKIDAQDSSRIFKIDASGAVLIGRIELVNGYSSGDGGAIRVESGSTLTVDRAAIRRSHADGAGGAISTDGAALTLTDATIAANSSDGGAGGIDAESASVTITGSILTANSTTATAQAMALYAFDPIAGGASVTIEDSLVSGNSSSAPNSPAVEVFGLPVTLNNVVIRDNTGTNIGALNVGTGFEIANSTISGNVGAISMSLSGSGSLVNSTVSGNSGFVQLNGDVDAEVFYSTITDNGVGVRMIGDAGLTIGGSIVAGNIGDDVEATSIFTGSMVTEGHNVIGVVVDDSAGGLVQFDGPLDMVGVIDPLLGGLASNGGLTKTHAVLAGSPAIDRVLVALTQNPSADQRGAPRPAGAKDSGAFEAVGLAPVRCNGEVPTIDMNVNGGVGAGTAHDDVIVGTSGDETITGLGGDDTICAGEGADTVRSGAGDDFIDGEGGDDDLAGGGGADWINGAGGDDTIDGQGGLDIIDGGDGADIIDGRGAADSIDGGAGDDIINGQNGADTLTGASGNDNIAGQTGPDTFFGGAGDDDMFGGNGADILYGGPDTDNCAGNTGPDQAEAATCETTPGVETLF